MIRAVFFKLLNFAVFIAFVLYYARKHIVPLLNKGIARERAIEESIKRKALVLGKEQHDVQQAQKEQEALYTRLTEKMKLWQAGVKFDRDTYMIAQREALTVRQERLRTQSQAYESYKIKKQIFPQALAQATQELLDFFHQEKHALSYNQRAIEILRGDSSKT